MGWPLISTQYSRPAILRRYVLDPATDKGSAYGRPLWTKVWRRYVLRRVNARPFSPNWITPMCENVQEAARMGENGRELSHRASAGKHRRGREWDRIGENGTESCENIPINADLPSRNGCRSLT